MFKVEALEVLIETEDTISRTDFINKIIVYVNLLWEQYSNSYSETLDRNRYRLGTTLDVLGWYHLNEISGSDVNDSSENNNDGICINMEDGDWVVGKLDNGLQFDGNDEYIDLGDIANFEKTDPFSIEFWFKTNVDHIGVFVSRYTNTIHRGWMAYLKPSGTVALSLATARDNRCVVYTIKDTFLDNNWYHVIITYDGSGIASGIHIYVNNIDESLVTFKNSLGGTILNTANCCLGRRESADLYYNGFLDEVVIYNFELNSEDVDYRYNVGSGIETMWAGAEEIYDLDMKFINNDKLRIKANKDPIQFLDPDL